MSLFPGIVFVAFMIVAALFAFFAHRQQAQRREDLARFASTRGWNFAAQNDRSFEMRYPKFDIFRRGFSRYAYNLMTGELSGHDPPIRVTMGDYHYKTKSGGKNKSDKTHRFSFAILDLPLLRTPDLQIRTENFFDRFTGMFGFDDIDFESAEFSDRFHVKSSDKRFAYDLIHPPMIEFLLATDPPVIELAGGSCCLFENGRCWEPRQFAEHLDWAEEFFARWPRHLIDELQRQDS